MAKRQTEIVAAGLLTSWTDSDTAMQIVGTSLGVFGSGSLDPTVVLATETPLRNALFDVLLSLVEGGAVELRTTDGSRYAFRWRTDIATAALSTDDAPMIDLTVPSPYLAELQRAQAERDDALGRAEFAEALAAERERQLRVVGVRGPTDPPEPAKSVEPEPAPVKRTARTPAPKAAPRKVPATKPPAKKATKKSGPVKPAAAKPAAAKVAAKPAAPKKPPAKKPAVTKARKSPAAHAPRPTEVVYLTPPVGIDLDAEPESTEPSRKWSGYVIDGARKHLAGVDRLVDEG